jgi:hypothetical protein
MVTVTLDNGNRFACLLDLGRWLRSRHFNYTSMGMAYTSEAREELDSSMVVVLPI